FDGSTTIRDGYQYQGDGLMTATLGTGHGCETMSLAIDGSDDGAAMVGVAPGCSGVGIPNQFSPKGMASTLEEIDVDGQSHNGPSGASLITPPDVAYQVAGISAFGGSSVYPLIAKGSLAFAGAENGLMYYSNSYGN